MQRQRRFKAQENRAVEDYAHVCNLEKQLFEEELCWRFRCHE